MAQLTLRRQSATQAESSGVQLREKRFPNNDYYKGGWKNGLPEGEGRYVWADGSVYEGAWREGAKHGLGIYTWPSGATYQGEWAHGYMHGVGTFQAPDGTRYQGGWARDLKQGLGRKLYANGDTYEGLWRAGKADGPGRYKWKNRNEYDGEWKAGKMHGQGTLKWATGERYDGEWVMGEEDGLGIFTWADSSTYDGFWKAGKKHGIGVYRPAPPDSKRATAPLERPLPAAVPTPQGGEAVHEPAAGADGVLLPSQEGPASQQQTAASEAHARAVGGTAANVFVREYDCGQLAREDMISNEELEAVFGTFHRRDEKRRRRRLRKDPKRPGETIFKGHRSYDLMLNLQLGIRHSTAHLATEPLPQVLGQDHFSDMKQNFPREGSKATPPHPSGEFLWKAYSPTVFRKLRDVFGIDVSEFLLSICGDQALRELPSPGKSGSVFFLSHDDKFIIKTMRKAEVKLLRDLLPRYTAHVQKHPHTLLIKFFGLYRVTPLNGKKVRFIVMNNLFRTDLPIHRKYDLKGSTQGRFSGKPPDADTILKDLDLDLSLKLEEGWHERLMGQLRADCGLLEELRVMDYSLLLGVHLRTTGYFSSPPATDKEDEGDDEGGDPPTPAEAGRASRSALRSSLGMPASPATPARLGAQVSDDGAGVADRTGRWDGGATMPAANGTTGAQIDAQMAAIQQRLLSQFGDRMSEKRMQDLLKLAQYKMLGRDFKAWRSPTMVLAMRPKRSDTLRPVAFSQGATDELAHTLGATRVHLGMNMAATAVPLSADGGAGAAPQPEDVVLYFGIIDILQEYNLSKKLEHGFKSIRHDGRTISAVDPKQYSHRFQDFMKRVFV